MHKGVIKKKVAAAAAAAELAKSKDDAQNSAQQVTKLEKDLVAQQNAVQQKELKLHEEGEITKRGLRKQTFLKEKALKEVQKIEKENMQLRQVFNEILRRADFNKGKSNLPKALTYDPGVYKQQLAQLANQQLKQFRMPEMELLSQFFAKLPQNSFGANLIEAIRLAGVPGNQEHNVYNVFLDALKKGNNYIDLSKALMAPETK